MKEKPEEKKKVLSGEFHIPMEKEIEKEMNDMCNLSDGVMELGRLEGMEKGRAEGRKEEKKEIALNMKSKGFDVATICQITGLTEDEFNQD